MNGPEYERSTCKRLSMWVSNFERKDVFWRSSMSGGRSTISRRKGEVSATAGDITCIDTIGEPLTSLFVLECKTYKNPKLEGYFFGLHPESKKWWDKLLFECQGLKQPLLIIDQAHKHNEAAFTSSEGMRILKAAGKLPVQVVIPSVDMNSFLLQDMLMLDFQRIRALYNRRMERRMRIK